MKKRIVATLLCVVMLLCAMPIVASAATYIDYNFGIQIETPHPGRKPDYNPNLIDTRFNSVEAIWFLMEGVDYPKVQATDTFVEGKEYLLYLRFRYNPAQYTCSSSTVSYINYAEQYPSKIYSESSTVSVLMLQIKYVCEKATITGTNSPKLTVTAPVAGAVPSANVLWTNSYNTKYTPTNATWYRVRHKGLNINENGSFKSNEDAIAGLVYAEKMLPGETFKAGYCYAAIIGVSPDTGYTFDSNTSMSINGVPAKGLFLSSVISATRLFICPGDVTSTAISDIETPVAGKFANPYFNVTIGDTFGENTILSSFSSAVPDPESDIVINGTHWNVDESNVKIFECGKNYFYMIWDGYTADDVTVNTASVLNINGKPADIYSVIGKSLLGYNLFTNVKCDASEKFTDMRAKSHWAHDALDFAYANGYLSGTSDKTISPAATLTRAMVVQVLYAYEGKPSVSGKSSFTDVKDTDWFAKAVLWASNNGIVSGVGEGKFNPNGKLTREQFALILMAFAKYKKMDVSKSDDLSAFSDKSTVSSWAENAVKWAVGEGFIAGSGGKVQPMGYCTREQFAVILRAFVLAKDCPSTTIIGNKPQ